jgi:hypothetical protein
MAPAQRLRCATLGWMGAVHAVFAWASVVAGVALLVAGGATAGGLLRSLRWLDRSILFLGAASLAAALVGLLIALTGAGPTDPLHILYGAVLVAGPMTVRYAVRDSTPRRIGTAMTVTALVVGGVLVRTFMTAS